MIKPTVGRIVHYRPLGYEVFAHFPTGGQPCAAIVTHVHSDRLVNLTVFDPNGVPYPRSSVTLVQEGDEKPKYSYCEWMQYQKDVASGLIPPTLHKTGA
jgi:hypothetical protein